MHPTGLEVKTASMPATNNAVVIGQFAIARYLPSSRRPDHPHFFRRSFFKQWGILMRAGVVECEEFLPLTDNGKIEFWQLKYLLLRLSQSKEPEGLALRGF